MNGAAPYRKGSRVERELRQLHLDIGIAAQRVPLSGADPNMPGDLRIETRAGVLVGEAKARKRGLPTLMKWLRGRDVLFIRRDGKSDPIVAMPWRTWALLVRGDL